MRDKQRQPSVSLGVLLLLFLVFPTFSMSMVINALFDGDVKTTEVDGGHPLPLGSLKESSRRNKRAFIGSVIGFSEVVMALTDFVTGNVRQSFENSGDDKDHREIVAHFERIQRELEQQTEELQSLNREIQKLGLSIIYSQPEKEIKIGLLVLREYLAHPNIDRNRNVFIEKASHLGQSIQVLVDGLLGQHSFSPDIMAVMRDVAKCESRKLRKNVKSVGSLIMTGLYVRGQYQRIINATEQDSSFFKEYIEASLLKLETRLDDMAIECQADETNVSDEMRKIMEATLTPNRKTVADSLLEFLEEKYDTKKWIVLVQEKSWENSVWTAGFHQASVRNDAAFAISVDRRAENLTEFTSSMLDLHLKEFSLPPYCHTRGDGYTCDCLSSFQTGKYLDRFLIPVRAKSEVEMETLAFSEKETQNLTVATSNQGERFFSMYSSYRTHDFRLKWCHHWVIVVPKRPAASSINNPSSPHSSPSSSHLRNPIECSYDPDQAAEEYGPLRNEGAQAYLTVQGDSNEEGASIILDREWRNSSGQKWKFVDGQLRNGLGKCLTLWWNVVFLGWANVYQYDCDRHWPHQKWDQFGLHIIHVGRFCLTFIGQVYQGPMSVQLYRFCDSSSRFVWYNRDTDCEDALVIPSTTNGSRPLRNEFSRLFLDVVDNYGTEQPWSNRPSQLWKFVDGLLKNDDGKCLAGKGWFVRSVDCAADQIGKNGRWTYTENRQIRSDEGYCLSRGDNIIKLYYNYCKDEPQQRWWYFS